MEKRNLRIVFLGTPEFAVESLDRLHKENYNIVGVVTMPDKAAGRGHHMLQSAVKKYAVDHGLHLMQPANLKDPAFVEELRSLNADLFIVIAFRMLPEIVWTMPRLGTFNLHASLLPKYRGAAPINWAVINGETETGVTTFFLKHEIDTGDIISQERVEIAPDDNVGDVHDRLMVLGAELTINTVRHILSGDLKPIPQDQLTGGVEPTPAPKIFKDTCHIDWNKSNALIHNLVRGLSPYPAAWSALSLDGKDAGAMKILKTKLIDHAEGVPGTISVINGRPIVSTADGGIELIEIQPAGKRPMEAAAWLRGVRFSTASLS